MCLVSSVHRDQGIRKGPCGWRKRPDLGEGDNRTRVNMHEMTVERENSGSGKV